MLTVGTAVALATPAASEPLPVSDVKAAMSRVEAALARLGIPVTGYAQTEPPPAEIAPSDHLYLQGSDGGYAGGRIYVNSEAIADCLDLTLVHELVHDATVKFRLLASVPNNRIKNAFEALADAVTAAAAEEPYRPGCLPDRHIEISVLDLPALTRVSASR